MEELSCNFCPNLKVQNFDFITPSLIEVDVDSGLDCPTPLKKMKKEQETEKREGKKQKLMSKNKKKK